MKINELNAPVQPDTYEASMFIKQAIRAGKYAIKIHDLLSNDQEMESWVAKKIDLATGYISTIGHYMEGQGISEDADDKQQIEYKPTIDTDEEWKEAGFIDPQTKKPRYPQLAKLGPGGFASLVNRGRNTKVTRPENIKNTTATSVQQAKQEFNNLELDKKQRFQQALQAGQIERPIVVRFGPGDTNDVLIAGNTRFTGLMAMGIQPEVKFIDLSNQKESAVQEDAGEGHMSKSQLYAAAKYCLNIASSVRPGDDIEGWVQTKMNRAVDMLDAVYHYEDYQRLNPYREDIGDLHQKHAQLIQKKIDEILATETDIDDIETKPGMLNILKRKVQEVEKKLAKEMREGSRMPSSMIQQKQKLDAMSPEEINHFFQKRAHFHNRPAKELARNQELRFGKQVAAMAPYSRHVQEDILDEGLKDWVKKMAAAGIIVGSLAGIGSVMNAIDNSVPVVQAMNTALDQAKNSGNMDLAKEINKDIKDAKLRLDIGKDLNQITYLQDKYKEYMPVKKNEDQSTDKDYPPHLQDLFKKLRAKQDHDKKIDAKVTDVTPAGYGPKDDAVKEYNLPTFKQRVMNKIAQPSKDYREKMAALQDIQNDPNTAKDPEAKKALAKRIEKLKTTGESRTVHYTNRLADMMGKRLGEGWSAKYKKSINCSNPKGFSQRAHCQGRKK